jgi:hypothetical protein
MKRPEGNDQSNQMGFPGNLNEFAKNSTERYGNETSKDRFGNRTLQD